MAKAIGAVNLAEQEFSLDTRIRYQKSFEVKIDWDSSFGYAEFEGWMEDETLQATSNFITFRRLPWLRMFYRYEDHDGEDKNAATESYSCEMKHGYTGGPCWQWQRRP